MILKQYSHPWLNHLSYLVVDLASRTGIVIDPFRDPDVYLEDAWRLGVPVRHVFLTQLHSDFHAGHLQLRDRTGAAVYLGAWARPDYAFTPVKDGDVLEFGDLRVKVLETPGHTLEAVSLLLFDLKRSERTPVAVLTGDTLGIGDVGRPDPVAGAPMTAREMALMLYDSIHGKILPLPDETLVYPGMAVATPCGLNPGTGDVSSTLGLQRHTNFALQPMGRPEFVCRIAADRPEADSFPAAAPSLNRTEQFVWKRDVRGGLRPATVAEVMRIRASGVQPVDVRDAADFAGAHLEGSIHIGLGVKFAGWAGRILEPRKPVVIVADPGREEAAAEGLRHGGVENVAGYLDGGMEALEGRPDLVRSTRRVAFRSLNEGPAGRTILDVRPKRERKVAAKVAGTLAIPLDELSRRMDEVPRDTEVVTASTTGYLSSIAASLLERNGFGKVSDLVGGLSALEGNA